MTVGRLRVGILVSGRGSNLEALLRWAELQDSPARVVLVGCNRADAPALEYARAAGVAVCIVDRGEVSDRADRQGRLCRAMQDAGVELLVLAGWDEILRPEFVAAFQGRAINTHPSLLPAFSGTMHAVRDALEYGVKVTGCTVHLVTDEPDAGPILLQRAVAVQDDDTVESLHARVRAQEHQLLPDAVRLLAEGRVRVEGRRARVVASAR